MATDGGGEGKRAHCQRRLGRQETVRVTPKSPCPAMLGCHLAGRDADWTGCARPLKPGGPGTSLCLLLFSQPVKARLRYHPKVTMPLNPCHRHLKSQDLPPPPSPEAARGSEMGLLSPRPNSRPRLCLRAGTSVPAPHEASGTASEPEEIAMEETAITSFAGDVQPEKTRGTLCEVAGGQTYTPTQPPPRRSFPKRRT